MLAELGSQDIHQQDTPQPNSHQLQAEEQQAQMNEEYQNFQNMNEADEDRQQRPQVTEKEIKRRKRARRREVEEQEANDFLKQPVVKIANLNKNLKRSYEKGFLDESKYEFIQTLRKIRKHPDQDSVSSHYGSDQSWDIRDVLPKRGLRKQKNDILSNSDSEEQAKKKRVSKPRQPRQPRKPREPKQPGEPRKPRQPRQPRVKSKELVKKEDNEKIKPIPKTFEPKKTGATIKITKAPIDMDWNKHEKKQGKRVDSDSESVNESESSFKSSSKEESEVKIIEKLVKAAEPLKLEEKKEDIIEKPKIKDLNNQEKVRLEVDQKKIINIVPLGKEPPPPPKQAENNPAVKSKDLQREDLKAKALKLKKDLIQQSDSSEYSSSSSSSSDSSSSFSDEESKMRSKRKDKKSRRKESSSDDSSSEGRKKKKKHRRHKKHKNSQSQKPAESLITKVLKQELKMNNVDMKTTEKVQSKKINQVEVEKHEKKDEKPEKKVQIPEKKTLLPEKKAELPELKIEKPKQMLPDINENKKETQIKEEPHLKEVIAVEPTQNKVKQRVDLGQDKNTKMIPQVQEVNKTLPPTISKKQLQIKPESKPIEKVDNSKLNSSSGFTEIKITAKTQEKERFQSPKELKPILKQDIKQVKVVLPAIIPQKPQAKLQKGADLPKNVAKSVENNKKDKKLALDNKVMVLQLMVGSSQNKNGGKTSVNFASRPSQQTKRDQYIEQDEDQCESRHKTMVKTLPEESDDSSEAVYYSAPRRPRYVPQKVVRFRKVIVESSEETDSSDEYLRRRVIRRVRKPIAYQSSSDASEEEAVDYRTSIRQPGHRRQVTNQRTQR